MGIVSNASLLKALGLFTAAALGAAASPALAAGDLLVAPTRVILDGSRGTEVVLNNIGTEPATYRISLEIKRMTAEGGLDEIAEENVTAAERTALDMIAFSPRRFTLPPNQPQVVRVGVRLPEGTPPGEYRRAYAVSCGSRRGASDCRAKAGRRGRVDCAHTDLRDYDPGDRARGRPRCRRVDRRGVGEGETQDGPAFNFDLARTGNRSVYGDIEVTRPGVAEPLLVARGIAVYPGRRAQGVAARSGEARGEAEGAGAHSLHRGSRNRRRHDRRGRAGGEMIG